MVDVEKLQEGDSVNHPTYGLGQIREIAQGTIYVSFHSWPGMYVFSIDDLRSGFKGKSTRSSMQGKRFEVEIPDKNWMKSTISNDYLNSYSIILERYGALVGRREIEKMQRQWVAKQFELLDTATPDEDQLDAISATEKRVLVTARAGSGKTRTIVNRAIFLTKFCGIHPSEILILAFNRSAAAEVKSRLIDFSNDFSKAHVMTFHALTYGLVHPEESLITDDVERNGSKIIAVEAIVKDLLENKEFSSDIMDLMLSFFRTDWETVRKGGWHLLNDKEQFLNFRRGLSNESMRGEQIKSLGEKVIADFLFQNDFDYKYERYFKWDRPYRPDFTIETGPDAGVVIEYFGMRGTPGYDNEIQEKMAYWESKPNWKLLSYYPEDLNFDSLDDLASKITADLNALGLSVNPLSEEELWKRIENRGTYQFTSTLSNSISKVRKLNLSPKEFEDMVSQYDSTDLAESKFLRLLAKIYSKYVDFLQSSSSDDFDGLINRGVGKIEEGLTAFVRKDTQGDLKSVKFIFIDEFQDFSEQFFRIIKASIEQNPKISLFCVGDDWQAINSFAGSDLKFFTSFEEHFGEFRTYRLLRNYRSGEMLVDLSNQIMVGLGESSISASESQGSIRLAELKQRNVSETEDSIYKGDRLTPALSKMLIQLGEKYSVAVLGHNRVSIPYYVRIGDQKGLSILDRFAEKIRSLLPQEVSKKVQFTTVHGFKGNEADVVLFLDPIERSFPSIHHTWRLQRIFGITHEGLEAEELRLLYVALTRAAQHLVLICNDSSELTPLISKVFNVNQLQPIDWSRIDQVGIDEIIVTVWSDGFGTRNISKELRVSKFFFRAEDKTWTKFFRAETFDLHAIQRSDWAKAASEIVVKVEYPDQSQTSSWAITNGNWTQI